MLSRLLPAGIAAAVLVAAAPALAEPAPAAIPFPPKKPDFGPMPSADETRDAMRTAAIDPAAIDPANAQPATPAAEPVQAVAETTPPARTERAPLPPSKPRFVLAAPNRAADPAQADAASPPAPAAGLFAAFAAPAAPAATETPANPLQSLFSSPAAAPSAAPASGVVGRERLNQLIAHHARINNVPESLVHRIVIRESRYNPRAVGRGGAMGLMQIKTATARGVGYQGGPGGLLDAETNLTYAVKYLAGAWRVSGGSQDRAVMHYARGYYYEAKRMGLHGHSRWTRRGSRPEAAPAVAAAPSPAPTLFSFFSQ